jgi:predicted nuclease with TOPRIM domain
MGTVYSQQLVIISMEDRKTLGTLCPKAELTGKIKEVFEKCWQLSRENAALRMKSKVLADELKQLRKILAEHLSQEEMEELDRKFESIKDDEEVVI